VTPLLVAMVIFTPHARQRIARRGLSVADVERTAEEPEITFPSATHAGREVRVRTCGSQRIAAVVEGVGSSYRVITAYDQGASN
jgi:hypothetical protein